jgi:hypothetical protein
VNRVREALLIVWLATIGADRMDLLAGRGPFLLTPFLALTPIVLIAEASRMVERKGRFRLPADASRYALAVASFLSIVLLSVFFSYNIEVSAQRYALLAVQVIATFLVAVSISDREDATSLLVRGSYLGLALAILFNVAQVTVLLTRSFDLHGPESVVDVMPKLYGLLPRLSGPSLDMNRGGFVVFAYLFLLLRLARPSPVRAAFVLLASVSLIGTLSRSVMLAVVSTAGAAVLVSWELGVSRPRVLAGALAIAGATLALLVTPAGIEALGEIAEPLSQRFTLTEGSTSEHLAVMERALDVASATPKQALLGVGFGNAYSVLQDFYPGNPYGNFHSLYLTLLAESGIVALGLGLILLVRPAVRGGWLQPFMVGTLFFNIFYQSIAEPIFWLVLALAWMRVALPPVGAREDFHAADPEAARPVILHS